MPELDGFWKAYGPVSREHLAVPLTVRDPVLFQLPYLCISYSVL